MRQNNQLSTSSGLIISILLLFIITFPSKVFSQKSPSDWKLITSEGDIKVYTRLSEKSSIKEVRITATCEVTLEEFIDAINDVPAYTKWVYKCKKPKLLKTINEGEFYYYLQSDLPFPLSDRDLVVHAKQWRDKTKKTFNTHSVGAPKAFKVMDGMVRVKSYESSWSISQNGDNSVKIDYTVLTDPGGSLPIWLINLTITQGPLHSMRNLKDYAKKKALLTRNG